MMGDDKGAKPPMKKLTETQLFELVEDLRMKRTSSDVLYDIAHEIGMKAGKKAEQERILEIVKKHLADWEPLLKQDLDERGHKMVWNICHSYRVMREEIEKLIKNSEVKG